MSPEPKQDIHPTNDEIKVSLVALSKEEHRKVKALFVQLIVLIVLSCSIALLVILSLYSSNQREQLLDDNSEAIKRQEVIVANLCSVIQNQIIVYNESNTEGSLPFETCVTLEPTGE